MLILLKLNKNLLIFLEHIMSLFKKNKAMSMQKTIQLKASFKTFTVKCKTLTKHKWMKKANRKSRKKNNRLNKQNKKMKINQTWRLNKRNRKQKQLPVNLKIKNNRNRMKKVIKLIKLNRNKQKIFWRVLNFILNVAILSSSMEKRSFILQKCTKKMEKQ